MSRLKHINHLLIEFYDKFSSWEQSVVKETGYSLPQIHTIEVLGELGSMPMKTLAQQLGITMGTLTVQVDKLVKLGLLKRVANPEDRRSTLVGLTQAGGDIHLMHNKLHTELTKELMSKFDESELAIFQTCLKKMNREF